MEIGKYIYAIIADNIPVYVTADNPTKAIAHAKKVLPKKAPAVHKNTNYNFRILSVMEVELAKLGLKAEVEA